MGDLERPARSQVGSLTTCPSPGWAPDSTEGEVSRARPPLATRGQHHSAGGRPGPWAARGIWHSRGRCWTGLWPVRSCTVQLSVSQSDPVVVDSMHCRDKPRPREPSPRAGRLQRHSSAPAPHLGSSLLLGGCSPGLALGPLVHLGQLHLLLLVAPGRLLPLQRPARSSAPSPGVGGGGGPSEGRGPGRSPGPRAGACGA